MLQGILVGIIEEEALQREISFEIGRTAAISILDSKGMLVVRTPNVDLNWDERNFLKRFPFVEASLNGRENVVTGVTGLEGDKRIVAIAPMPFGWVAWAGRSEEKVTGAIWAHLTGRIILFLGVLAAGLIAAASVSRQIARGVQSLREKSESVARGEYIPKAQVSKTIEFQELSTSLDAMSLKVREREEALRESERKLAAVIEQLPVGVGVLNSNGQFTLNNSILKSYAPRTIPSKDPERIDRWRAFNDDGSLIPPSQWPAARALKGESVSPGMELQYTEDSGELSWKLISAVPFLNPANEIAGAILVVQDITQRKKTEEALRESEEVLRHMNEKLESTVRERTANLVAANHELEKRAQQLRLLAGELTMAEQRERKRLAKVLHDGLQQYLVAAKMQVGSIVEEIANNSTKQSALGVESLLEESISVSRSLAAELSPPILHDAGILSGMEWLARWMITKHGLNVDLVVEMDSPVLSEDVKTLLFESVRELLLNVVKHAKTDSARVHLRQDDRKNLRITVGDSGKGFDPECTLNGSSGIGGFGLFSIRERIELLGGHLEVESALGEGARFSLIVPLGVTELKQPATSLQPQKRYAPAQSCLSGPRAITTKILITDDHAVMREGLARLLAQEADFEVIGQASDGQEAVDMAESLRPDVILMDISMPCMNGIDATRIIHQHQPDIRIIGLSLYTEGERAREMLTAGASFYMTKSSPPSELKQAIRSCMASGHA